MPNTRIGASEPLGAETLEPLKKFPEGRSILNLLVESGVHTNGVVTDSAASTGHSYLTAASNGEYSVVSYSGANRFLDTQPINSRYWPR